MLIEFQFQFLNHSIDEWAIRFGDELWELGETMTKAKEIKQVITEKYFLANDSHNGFLSDFLSVINHSMHVWRRKMAKL